MASLPERRIIQVSHDAARKNIALSVSNSSWENAKAPELKGFLKLVYFVVSAVVGKRSLISVF